MAGPSSDSPDSTRRSASSRAAVLAAALELVGEVGYERMTIEAVAARAGVGKQTIYRWWSSKGAVLVEAFVEAMATASAAPDEVPLTTSGDVAETLHRLVSATVREFSRHHFEAPYRAVVVAMQGDAELADEVLRRVIRPSIAEVTAWLETQSRAGALRAGIDAPVAFEVIFGPIFHRWLLRTAPMDDAYAASLSELVVAALVD